MPQNGNNSASFFDGLFYKNTVFTSGLVIAPVVCAAKSVTTALALSFVFTILTFTSVSLSSYFSRKVVYTFRIILYTLVAAMVYVPTVLLAQSFFPGQIQELGVYAPLLISNSLIVSKSELKLYRMKRPDMLKTLASYVLGFDLAALFFGASREFLLEGFSSSASSFLTFPALAYPFGGFILLGVLAALFRRFTIFVADGKGGAE